MFMLSLHVQLCDRRDDAQVEAVGIGVVLGQPSIRERDEEQAPRTAGYVPEPFLDLHVADRLHEPTQLVRRPEGLGRQVLSTRERTALLVQIDEPAALERGEGAARHRVEQRLRAHVRRPLRIRRQPPLQPRHRLATEAQRCRRVTHRRRLCPRLGLRFFRRLSGSGRRRNKGHRGIMMRG